MIESKVVCKDEKQCLEIPDSPTTTPAESQPAMPPPTLPHTSHAANTDILSATPAAAVVSPMLLHTLPNMSRVDTKPKLCNLPCPDSNDSTSITSPELFTSKTHTGKTRISKGIGEQIANKLSKVLDKIGKGRVSPPAGDSVTAAKSISDSEMSPSEIVKLRKRGKKKSTTPKKLKSPLKPSPHGNVINNVTAKSMCYIALVITSSSLVQCSSFVYLVLLKTFIKEYPIRLPSLKSVYTYKLISHGWFN